MTGRLVPLFALALVLGLLGPIACDESSPTAPSDPDSVFAGTWTGTGTDSVAGQTSFRLVLSERDGRLSGTWSASFPGGAISGSLDGPAGASPFVLRLSCIPGGIGGINATRDGTRITGTYFFVGCAGLGDGTLEVTKQ